MPKLLHVAIILIATQVFAGCAPVLIGGAAAGMMLVHDRRTAGSVLDDEGIELNVINALYAENLISDLSHINVTSYNGVVLLTGETRTEAGKRKAENITRNTTRVKKVVNEIALAAPSSLTSRSSDSMLTTKVKVQLLKIRGHRGFDPTRVKVVTERGIVYLLGLVTPEEATAATETAREIRGVQRVVKVFELVTITDIN